MNLVVSKALVIPVYIVYFRIKHSKYSYNTELYSTRQLCKDLEGMRDHFPEASNISCHIRIVNPLNAKTVYLVQVKEGPQILTFNLAGVKTFISNYLYVKKIQGLKANNAKKNKTAKQTSKKSAPTCTVEWVNFWKEVAKNIPNYKVTTNKKKVTYRLFKGASVSTVVEKLKAAIKAKALYAASSSNYLKEY